MSARAHMTMRAQVERNVATGRDRNNQPAPEEWEPIADRLPCFLWSARERQVDGSVNAWIESLHLGIPAAADITPADRINGVFDRAGAVIDASIFRITADRRMGRSHRELDLEIVASATGAAA